MSYHLFVLVAALAQNVQKKNRSLPEIARILTEGGGWNRLFPGAHMCIDFMEGALCPIWLDNSSSTREGLRA
jgi:ubiquinone/menaquinone biosynthesis C-methylase UbiE